MYIRNLTTGFDILISTRYDYDDIIYYDAVNDVRKLINEKKPMFLHGYNRGLVYFEKNGKYYDFEKKYADGAMSVFPSLITVLGKVNDSYTIHDLGNHALLKKTLLKNYKSFGIKELNYDPAIFESGSPKFIYVRQIYSSTYNSININKIIKIGINAISDFVNFKKSMMKQNG